MPVSIIENLLPNIPENSGIYQFFDKDNNVLYVGKAKNLKKRLISYTALNRLSNRIRRMVYLATKLEFTNTATELEALLLEHNLIKKLSPRFNILLKDAKTFPYILISQNHEFPSITKHRGAKSINGNYFGPFASAMDVNRTIDVLRKSFLLRNCSDSEFAGRKKPCLEYQIKRCHGPCTNLITKEEYHKSVNHTIDFLSGKSSKIQSELAKKMQELSDNLEYEKAAMIRDKIKSLSSIQAKQNIHMDELMDTDIITAIVSKGQIAILVSFYRAGNNYGHKNYYYNQDLLTTQEQEEQTITIPADQEKPDLTEFLTDFLGQFYLNHIPPANLLFNTEISYQDLIENYLSELTGKKVTIFIPKKGNKFKLIKDQEQLTSKNLEQEILRQTNNKELLIEIKKLFNLEKTPQIIEVYDNSHISGQYRVGAMICAGPEGFIKNRYRKFNIDFGIYGKQKLMKNLDNSDISKDILDPKDDTAMLKEVLYRRFKRLLNEDKERKLGLWPDLVIIDGGKGQLSAAKEIFTHLGLTNLKLVCMSKGENRNAGEEYFHQFDQPSFTLPKNHQVMFYLQRLRDEAHRFAITSHKNRRSKLITKSSLDEISGIGRNRKKLLLNHFGSVEKIKSASIEDLCKVAGINKFLSQKILDNLK